MVQPRTLYQWFQNTVDRYPDAQAIDFGDECFSYAQLHQLATKYADHLAALNLPRNSVIGLLGGRQLSTYVAYLAILQLGHAVAPISPDQPPVRNESVIRLAGMSAAIVDENAHPDLAHVLHRLGVTIVGPQSSSGAGPSVNPGDRGRSDDVAYLLFTSGSTGRPKGVPIDHRQACAYLAHVIAQYGLAPGARLSHTFALTFDPSVFDLFGSWGSGATLVVPRKRELLAPAHYVSARMLTHWYSVPSLIAYGRRIGNLRAGSMPGLCYSRFIGEPLSSDLAKAWSAAAPCSVIENVYGPTELTVSCAEYRLPRDPADWMKTSNGTIPIGTVYPHLEWRIADPHGGDSDEGELWVRGPQRFSGYLTPTDNAGAFAREGDGGPPVGVIGDRDWYRTGDRVRHTKAGLVHLGRLDRQVKIQGHRVELGDVEAALRRHPAVAEAAAIAVPDGHDGLALHAILCGEPDDDLDAFLRRTLPPYMVPRVTWVSDFPHNASGKVDYAALRSRVGEV